MGINVHHLDSSIRNFHIHMIAYHVQDAKAKVQRGLALRDVNMTMEGISDLGLMISYDPEMSYDSLPLSTKIDSKKIHRTNLADRATDYEYGTDAPYNLSDSGELVSDDLVKEIVLFLEGCRKNALALLTH